jgi:outer membrane immunogenic protein
MNWSGPYVGLQGSVLQGTAVQEIYDGDAFYQSRQSLSGWELGGHAGFLKQFENNFILGVELDSNLASFSDYQGPFFVWAPEYTGPLGNIVGTVNMKWNAAVRLRAGYAIDRFLPYVAGGIAIADVEYGYNYATLEPLPDKRGGDLLVGWTLGAGLEYALTETVSGRLEVRHTDYGAGHAALTGGPFPATPSKLDLTENRVELGLSLKF